MLYPIGDSKVIDGYKPILAWLFLLINVGVFLYQISLGHNMGNAFVNHYGAIPNELVNGQDWLMAWTSMFLHGGWMHLIGNMLFLYVFADNIEATVGHVRFFLFYFLGGLAALIAQVIATPYSAIPMVGASGCISAVLGAYLVMFPKNKVRLMFFFVIRFWIPAILFLGFWGVQQFLAGYGSIAKTADTGGVAYWAHIGGFIFGVASGFYFRKTRKYR